jgi:ribosome modulation factor
LGFIGLQGRKAGLSGREHGIKCYFLKLKDRVEFISQNPEKMADHHDFTKKYGNKFTTSQRTQLLWADSIECEMVGGI